MIVGVMKDYKLKQRDLRSSHTLGWSWNWNTGDVEEVFGFKVTVHNADNV